jgi:hypothetical protein
LAKSVQTLVSGLYDFSADILSTRRYRSRLLCRGPQALGKTSKALGKAFAERSSRQSALGENPIGKGFFAESRLLGTRQSFCRVLDARQSAK